MNHGDFTYTFKDNVGNDDTDSAYDATLGNMLDNYQSSFVGFFGDDATGIGATLVNSEQRIVNSVFDLQGRKVAQPTKGLYIVNGKKVMQ